MQNKLYLEVSSAASEMIVVCGCSLFMFMIVEM